MLKAPRQKTQIYSCGKLTGDEIYICYDNTNCKDYFADSGEVILSPKRKIHGEIVLLCIKWDMKGVTLYELLLQSTKILVLLATIKKCCK